DFAVAAAGVAGGRRPVAVRVAGALVARVGARRSRRAGAAVHHAGVWRAREARGARAELRRAVEGLVPAVALGLVALPAALAVLRVRQAAGPLGAAVGAGLHERPARAGRVAPPHVAAAAVEVVRRAAAGVAVAAAGEVVHARFQLAGHLLAAGL